MQMSPALAALITTMLAYEATAFEADEEVDGGDMVETFAEWRPMLKALAEAPETAPQVVIVIKGGMVEDAYAFGLPDSASLIVADRDNDCDENMRLVMAGPQRIIRCDISEERLVPLSAPVDLEAKPSMPSDPVKDGEFAKCNMAGYHVAPVTIHETGKPEVRGFLAITPDDDSLGHYLTERAAWYACDVYRRFDLKVPPHYGVRDAAMSGYPGPYYVVAPDGSEVAKRENEVAAVQAAMSHAAGRPIDYEVMGGGTTIA